MKTKLLSASILGFGLLVSATIIANGAFAQTADDVIQYPVAELGGCEDRDACKVYCDDADNLEACLSFAEENNLMSEDEIVIAKKFMEAGGKGPGGCTGKDSCQTYCDDINHIDACIAFAEKSGILPPEELAEAKQVQAAIARGVKPPACGGKKACDAYCEDPSNMKECITFGEASGFLEGKELEDAKKMLIAINNGAIPPPCRGRDACDAYCSEPDNMEACMTFAQAAGFMTEEEAQNSEKMLTALKKGVKPPACKGKEACDAYCGEPAHTDECISFAVAAGFMSEKDAEMAKRTGGKGPGGCTGKDACEAFCGNSENQEICVNFAKDNGMLGEGDMRSGPSGTPNVSTAEECSKYGGDWNGTRCDFGVKECGNQGGSWDGTICNFPSDQSGGAPRGLPPGEYRGPGGCSSEEECQAYCMANPEACQGFAPPSGGTGYQTGPPPGIDHGAEECTKQGGSWDGSACNFAPIMPTGPQSFNFDLNSSLAAVITVFRESKF
ncbi:MAG: hypothetical protein AAB850_02355 [Patescibacteria group bacterium]